MSLESGTSDLIKVVTLLGAAVVAVPIFRRLGMGSILGYLISGLIIGPFGLKLITHPETILHVAELGVVMFLFVIGLEMRPSHLWSLRKDIFGLGPLQIIVCTALITILGFYLGFAPMVSFIGAMGFVLTSTAIVMQLLSERGDLSLPRGQKIVSILLFEDLLIVPLLAFVAFMAPTQGDSHQSHALTMGIAFGGLFLLVIVGRWVINPLFRLLALAQAREVMTAAALLVVLGSALLMQMSGLSMAMGAFLAGVLLAESSFRHQIEADIEPFRGILLGLFFISVGMALDLFVVAENWKLIISAVLIMMTIKGCAIYFVARVLGTSHQNALDRGIIMAQGGEFAFVFFTAALGAGLIDPSTNANLVAIVVLSMAFTPVIVAIYRLFPSSERTSLEGVEIANGQSGKVLVIGFGRFGQVVSQLLLARNIDVTIIDSDPEMIRSASRFGFKIYFGDGTRLDVLRASGALTASAVAICVNKKEAASKITEIVKAEMPHLKILARSYDRIHARELVGLGVDYQMRETFESALLFGEATLREIGVDESEIEVLSADIRRRDKERFQLEILKNETAAGRSLLHSNMVKPLTNPQRSSQALNDDAKDLVKEN